MKNLPTVPIVHSRSEGGGQQTGVECQKVVVTHLENLSEQGGWERSLDGVVAPVLCCGSQAPSHCTTQRWGGERREQWALLGVSGQLRKWLGA